MSESSTAELYIYDGFKVAYVDTSYANGSYIVRFLGPHSYSFIQNNLLTH